MLNNNNNLLFLELNEINFDIVRKYIESNLNLNNFKKIFSFKNINTVSEENYEEIEPWIQWHSVHTGLSFSEHKIFRLGDGINCKQKGIYKEIEELGYSVGAISPMNLKNNLSNPMFYIPDPWTETISDKSWWSHKIHQILYQAVNDNASSKINFDNIFYLLLALIKFGKIKNYFNYFYLAFTSLFGKTWRKALFLDLFLSDVALFNIKKYKPSYASLFLNGGAHIQHHYFFNSKMINKPKNPSWYVNSYDDPVLEMLKIYDRILGHILKLKIPFILATGMSQTINEDKEYYYRLKDHEEFLKLVNIKFKEVRTRMSRDFEVLFNSNNERDIALNLLSSLEDDKTGERLFEEIEIRNNSLFVALTFSREIKNNTNFKINNKKINLFDKVVFVAIKNGKHQSKGFAFFSENIDSFMPKNNSHVKKLYNSIMNYFLESKKTNSNVYGENFLNN